MAVVVAKDNRIKRLDLKVGYKCNNDCLCCVVADKRKWGDKSTAEIRKELEDSYAEGKREIVFTGGECTIREDIIDLVGFARKLGFSLVQIQTNGRTMSDLDFAKRMVAAGMNQFAPALHGHTRQIHDYITQRKGSWRQTVLGINNVRKLGVLVATNTVITKQNYRYLPKIAALLVKLGVVQFQFAFPHLLGNAYKNYKDIIPRVSDVSPYIKRGITVGLKANIPARVEAVTPCLLQGYEYYISDLNLPSVQVKEVNWQIDDFALVRKTEAKRKFSQCSSCKWDNVCEGSWKEYPDIFGEDEFKPVR